MFANTDVLAAPVIMSVLVKVKEGVKNVGVAFGDTSERMMGVSEFVDNDLFSNLEVSCRFLLFVEGGEEKLIWVGLVWVGAFDSIGSQGGSAPY